MHQQIKIGTNTARFRRWKRAGYAIFASLAVVVTIGVLAVGICEKSILKTSDKISECAQTQLSQFAENDDDLQEIATQIILSEQTKNYTSRVTTKNSKTHKAYNVLNNSYLFFVNFTSKNNFRKISNQSKYLLTSKRLNRNSVSVSSVFLILSNK